MINLHNHVFRAAWRHLRPQNPKLRCWLSLAHLLNHFFINSAGNKALASDLMEANRVFSEFVAADARKICLYDSFTRCTKQTNKTMLKSEGGPAISNLWINHLLGCARTNYTRQRKLQSNESHVQLDKIKLNLRISIEFLSIERLVVYFRAPCLDFTLRRIDIWAWTPLTIVMRKVSKWQILVLNMANPKVEDR